MTWWESVNLGEGQREPKNKLLLRPNPTGNECVFRCLQICWRTCKNKTENSLFVIGTGGAWECNYGQHNVATDDASVMSIYQSFINTYHRCITWLLGALCFQPLRLSCEAAQKATIYACIGNFLYWAYLIIPERLPLHMMPSLFSFAFRNRWSSCLSNRESWPLAISAAFICYFFFNKH